jgi:catechol 2,3-dioxygenase
METPEPGSPLRVRELGHVSLFVRDLEATRRFYRDLLGLTETGTGKNGRVVFFSAGVHHHDVSCELARADGPGPQPKGVPGLYHIAFDVGVSRADLDAARARVQAHGLAPFGEGETYFCVRDPDGHEIELYVDVENRLGDQDTARERRGSGRTRQMETTPAASAATAKPNAGR